jgi:5-formyltetrahydrofolate cyclo-ligase
VDTNEDFINCHDEPMTGSVTAQASDSAAREAKRALRRRLREDRAATSQLTRDHQAAGFAAALDRLLSLHPEGPVLAFLPLPHEPPLTEALRELMTRRSVLLPVTQPERSMLWTRWLPATSFARSGPGGLPEPVGPMAQPPADLGLVLVPALAVDAGGLRLGMGGGFYDTFLQRLGPEVPAAACVFAREVLPLGSVPAQPWDARLPLALTETGLIELKGPRGGEDGAGT